VSSIAGLRRYRIVLVDVIRPIGDIAPAARDLDVDGVEQQQDATPIYLMITPNISDFLGQNTSPKVLEYSKNTYLAK